uniref:DNA-directed RNA polymerase n=1 Tax=Pandorina morum TaxID=33099 RepID=A0A6C0RUI6_PANMO|nr:RNA polymerase beta' subunit [Pandorina morum]
MQKVYKSNKLLLDVIWGLKIKNCCIKLNGFKNPICFVRQKTKKRTCSCCAAAGSNLSKKQREKEQQATAAAAQQQQVNLLSNFCKKTKKTNRIFQKSTTVPLVIKPFSQQQQKSMFFNYTFDKGRLKNLVSWTLDNYGQYKTVELLEQLKKTGFEYATKAGISLGIDDLKIPPKKQTLLLEAEKQTKFTRHQYERAEITAVERFQRLIETWHRTSEQLKQDVINYFEETDVLNPVYMMAFSGARGNISQVRQLVGMRGLMSDPQGQIIDFPIRSNFREGLTLTEYIISSYGARKGIVDTALRTANAGYLTRRLVDVAQHVIISHFDCGTQKGIFLTDMKEGNKTLVSAQTRIIGRVLARDIYKSSLLNEPVVAAQQQEVNPDSKKAACGVSHKQASQYKVFYRNQEISSDLAFEITKITNKIFVRSSLTCNTTKLLCQLCYGWSLAQGNLVSVGETVGVIAAQSIGEPGTQLTMRTFHTGGVFSGSVTDEIRALSDGFVQYEHGIPGILIRLMDGKVVFLTKSEGLLIFTSKKNKTDLKKYKIPPYTILFIRNGEAVLQKQVIAQITSIQTKANITETSELVIKADFEGIFYGKNQTGKDKIEKFMIGPKPKYVGQAKQTLLIDPKAMEIIIKSRGWNLDWVLSGKRYEVPLLLKSFPILGDYITPNTIITRYNLQLPTAYPLKLNILTTGNKLFKTLNIIKTSSSHKPALKGEPVAAAQQQEQKILNPSAAAQQKQKALLGLPHKKNGAAELGLLVASPQAGRPVQTDGVGVFDNKTALFFTKKEPPSLKFFKNMVLFKILLKKPKTKKQKKKAKLDLYKNISHTKPAFSLLLNTIKPAVAQQLQVLRGFKKKQRHIELNENLLTKIQEKLITKKLSLRTSSCCAAAGSNSRITFKLKQDLVVLNLQKIKYKKIGYFHFFNPTKAKLNYWGLTSSLSENVKEPSAVAAQQQKALLKMPFFANPEKKMQPERLNHAQQNQMGYKKSVLIFNYNFAYSSEIMFSPVSLKGDYTLKQSTMFKEFLKIKKEADFNVITPYDFFNSSDHYFTQNLKARAQQDNFGIGLKKGILLKRFKNPTNLLEWFPAAAQQLQVLQPSTIKNERLGMATFFKSEANHASFLKNMLQNNRDTLDNEPRVARFKKAQSSFPNVAIRQSNLYTEPTKFMSNAAINKILSYKLQEKILNKYKLLYVTLQQTTYENQSLNVCLFKKLRKASLLQPSFKICSVFTKPQNGLHNLQIDLFKNWFITNRPQAEAPKKALRLTKKNITHQKIDTKLVEIKPGFSYNPTMLNFKPHSKNLNVLSTKSLHLNYITDLTKNMIFYLPKLDKVQGLTLTLLRSSRIKTCCGEATTRKNELFSKKNNKLLKIETIKKALLLRSSSRLLCFTKSPTFLTRSTLKPNTIKQTLFVFAYDKLITTQPVFSPALNLLLLKKKEPATADAAFRKKQTSQRSQLVAYATSQSNSRLLCKFKKKQRKARRTSLSFSLNDQANFLFFRKNFAQIPAAQQRDPFSGEATTSFIPAVAQQRKVTYADFFKNDAYFKNGHAKLVLHQNIFHQTAVKKSTFLIVSQHKAKPIKRSTLSKQFSAKIKKPSRPAAAFLKTAGGTFKTTFNFSYKQLFYMYFLQKLKLKNNICCQPLLNFKGVSSLMNQGQSSADLPLFMPSCCCAAATGSFNKSNLFSTESWKNKLLSWLCVSSYQDSIKKGVDELPAAAAQQPQETQKKTIKTTINSPVFKVCDWPSISFVYTQKQTFSHQKGLYKSSKKAALQREAGTKNNRVTKNKLKVTLNVSISLNKIRPNPSYLRSAKKDFPKNGFGNKKLQIPGAAQQLQVSNTDFFRNKKYFVKHPGFLSEKIDNTLKMEEFKKGLIWIKNKKPRFNNNMFPAAAQQRQVLQKKEEPANFFSKKEQQQQQVWPNILKKNEGPFGEATRRDLLLLRSSSSRTDALVKTQQSENIKHKLLKKITQEYLKNAFDFPLCKENSFLWRSHKKETFFVPFFKIMLYKTKQPNVSLLKNGQQDNKRLFNIWINTALRQKKKKSWLISKLDVIGKKAVNTLGLENQKSLVTLGSKKLPHLYLKQSFSDSNFLQGQIEFLELLVASPQEGHLCTTKQRDVSSLFCLSPQCNTSQNAFALKKSPIPGVRSIVFHKSHNIPKFKINHSKKLNLSDFLKKEPVAAAQQQKEAVILSPAEKNQKLDSYCWAAAESSLLWRSHNKFYSFVELENPTIFKTDTACLVSWQSKQKKDLCLFPKTPNIALGIVWDSNNTKMASVKRITYTQPPCFNTFLKRPCYSFTNTGSITSQLFVDHKPLENINSDVFKIAQKPEGGKHLLRRAEADCKVGNFIEKQALPAAAQQQKVPSNAPHVVGGVCGEDTRSPNNLIWPLLLKTFKYKENPMFIPKQPCLSISFYPKQLLNYIKTGSESSKQKQLLNSLITNPKYKTNIFLKNVNQLYKKKQALCEKTQKKEIKNNYTVFKTVYNSPRSKLIFKNTFLFNERTLITRTNYFSPFEGELLHTKPYKKDLILNPYENLTAKTEFTAFGLLQNSNRPQADALPKIKTKSFMKTNKKLPKQINTNKEQMRLAMYKYYSSPRSFFKQNKNWSRFNLVLTKKDCFGLLYKTKPAAAATLIQPFLLQQQQEPSTTNLISSEPVAAAQQQEASEASLWLKPQADLTRTESAPFRHKSSTANPKINHFLNTILKNNIKTSLQRKTITLLNKENHFNNAYNFNLKHKWLLSCCCAAATGSITAKPAVSSCGEGTRSFNTSKAKNLNIDLIANKAWTEVGQKVQFIENPKHNVILSKTTRQLRMITAYFLYCQQLPKKKKVKNTFKIRLHKNFLKTPNKFTTNCSAAADLKKDQSLRLLQKEHLQIFVKPRKTRADYQIGKEPAFLNILNLRPYTSKSNINWITYKQKQILTKNKIGFFCLKGSTATALIKSTSKQTNNLNDVFIDTRYIDLKNCPELGKLHLNKNFLKLNNQYELVAAAQQQEIPKTAVLQKTKKYSFFKTVLLQSVPAAAQQKQKVPFRVFYFKTQQVLYTNNNQNFWEPVAAAQQQEKRISWLISQPSIVKKEILKFYMTRLTKSNKMPKQRLNQILTPMNVLFNKEIFIKNIQTKNQKKHRLITEDVPAAAQQRQVLFNFFKKISIPRKIKKDGLDKVDKKQHYPFFKSLSRTSETASQSEAVLKQLTEKSLWHCLDKTHFNKLKPICLTNIIVQIKNFFDIHICFNSKQQQQGPPALQKKTKPIWSNFTPRFALLKKCTDPPSFKSFIPQSVGQPFSSINLRSVIINYKLDKNLFVWFLFYKKLYFFYQKEILDFEPVAAAQQQVTLESKNIPAAAAQQQHTVQEVSSIRVIKKSGQVIHMNKEKITIRIGQPLVISPRSIIHASHGDFISYKTSVITLTYQQLKTGDIVQGIPKIEQLFEARTTKRGRLFRDNVTNLLTGLFLKYFVKSVYFLRNNSSNLQTVKQQIKNKLGRQPGQTIQLAAKKSEIQQDQTGILGIALQWAVKQSFYKIQQIIVDGILRVYRSQGVTIADKHVEIIVKQMTTKVRIINSNKAKLLDYSFTLKNVNAYFYDTITTKAYKEPLLLQQQQTSQVKKKLGSAELKKNSFINIETSNLLPAAAQQRQVPNSSSKTKITKSFENNLLEQLISNNSYYCLTSLFPGEIVDLDFIENINKTLQLLPEESMISIFEPVAAAQQQESQPKEETATAATQQQQKVPSNAPHEVGGVRSIKNSIWPAAAQQREPFIKSIVSSRIQQIKYEPIVLGITRASLEVESFLSAASFQQTTRVLSQAALYNKKDFLKGLKENIIIGNLIPAGTGYITNLKI